VPQPQAATAQELIKACMSKANPDARLNVMARAPFHKYYEGPAKSVSAANGVGKFDILPGHANFFSVMVPGDVVIETDKDVINFPD
jgi:F0F1-type ATP synthase epsilon subunit